MVAVTFDVPGVPAPKGSARAIRRGGYAVLVASGSDANQSAQRAWAAAVGWSARAARVPLLTCPVAVHCVFRFARPVSHTRAQRASQAHTHKPDVDKLLRCTLDALTGIAYADDRQCVDVRGVKRWCAEGEAPGAMIEVRTVDEPGSER